jgi:multisubunit Na+/H+ antiporter MnhE subunit
MKAWAAIALLLRFLGAVAVSGVQTVSVILMASFGERRVPPAAFVRVRFAPMSEAGAALLGSMVSLTPGTTTLDIDMAQHELLLHVLDTRDIDGLVRGIRTQFEPSLLTLFGTDAGAMRGNGQGAGAGGGAAGGGNTGESQGGSAPAASGGPR